MFVIKLRYNEIMSKVRKAIIAAAGFGTRFLPQTKAMPKEMLPLIDKPIIQYIAEQLAEAGIEDIIIVTGYHKRSIEDHFDYISADLRANLKQAGKLELLEQTKKISDIANFAYVRQKGPYGSATPIMNAQHLIGDEPFIYTYADDLLVASPNHFAQLIAQYEQVQAPVLPCLHISSAEEYERYGVIGGEPESDGLVRMSTIVEKPGKENSPSDLASIGGYLLTPEIFSYLEKDLAQHDASKGEFQIQPAMRAMIADNKPLYGMRVEGATYYDTGNKLEYLKTVIDFGLKDQNMGADLQAYLKMRLNELS